MSTKDFKFRLENERDELRTKVLKLADFLGRIITEDMNITPIQ